MREVKKGRVSEDTDLGGVILVMQPVPTIGTFFKPVWIP